MGANKALVFYAQNIFVSNCLVLFLSVSGKLHKIGKWQRGQFKSNETRVYLKSGAAPVSQSTPFITELPRVCVWACTVVYVWDLYISLIVYVPVA